ncbi:MAG: ribose transport system substrate-binding protein [Actinomycetota bacterium]|jgi:ribose transport system substrate-binding protein|nr:periplasmic binding protein/LacI transcriptional regulator [Cryptosporangiaceae bacterium]MDQ1676746.1 ribose transport system substrate-binding protein [Actinomycetota bacterium]
MRKSTHLGVLATALMLVTGLAACGSSGGKSSAAGDFTISAANYTEAAALFRVIHTNLDDVIKAKDTGVAVKWYDNAGDPAKMTQNARLMVQDKPDAIVMYPVSNTTQGIGKIIGDSKIPCVSVNLATPNCAFLNIDNRALGIDSAKIVGAEAKKRGWNASNTTVLIGQNAASGEQVNDCVRYFHSTIAPILGLPTVEPTSITPNMTKVSANAIQFDGGSQLQPSFKAVKNLLPSIPKNHNIILYTVNNDSTVGALRALQDAGRAGNDTLLMAGLGGDEQGIKALREDPRWVAEGDIFVSWWGQYAVAMAQALAKGAKPPAEVTLLPQVVLDKNTVDTYHQPGSVDVKQLPPLVESNDYLKQGGFLQVVGNIEGLK